MRFERRLTTEKPPREALRLIADFRHLKSWDDSVVTVTPRQTVFEQGAQFDVAVRFSGRVIELCYTLTAYEPGVRAVLTGVAPKATAIDVIEVRREGDVTVIEYSAEIQLAFPYRLFDPLLRRGFENTVNRAVEGLSRFLSS